ncbi:MAG: PAS domain-containing sensor histidine kinase [Gemmataceae bacterium]
MPDTPSTYFASPDRAGPSELARQRASVAGEPLIQSLIDAMPEMVVLVNAHRQIVAVNELAARWLGRPIGELIGLRPGEAMGCAHAADGPAGCGTSPFCKVCGAVHALVQSQSTDQPCVGECRILRTEGTTPPALDFAISVRPLTLNNERFQIFALRDLADEKRRQLLERMFFHDVLNAAGGLRGILELWPELDGAEAREMEEMARQLAASLFEEIESQRDIAAAERGDLEVTIRPVDVAALLEQVCALYRHHLVAQGKRIAQPIVRGPARLDTSDVLLRRVLGNLLKNALEASRSGETVTVSFTADPMPTFAVYNPGVMSEEVKLQIFQRSFSTKGAGRGIGSYSVN